MDITQQNRGRNTNLNQLSFKCLTPGQHVLLPKDNIWFCHRDRNSQETQYFSSSWNRACLQTNHIEMQRQESRRQQKTCSHQSQPPAFIIWGGPQRLEWKSVPGQRKYGAATGPRERARRILWGENGVPDRDTNFQDNGLRLIVNEEDRIF